MSSARERTRAAQGKPAKSGYPVFKVRVNGEEIVVDRNTFTGVEQRLMKREFAKLGYTPENSDAIYASAWITVRRTEKDLTFDEFLEGVTSSDLDTVAPADASEDDSPEV